MKVTKIEAQIKAKGRYSIYVDGKFSFGLSELGLINSGLSIGKDLSQEELDELKNQSEIDKIYNRLLSLVISRPRSYWEAEQYLKRKSVDKETSSVILNLLSKNGFLNDEDFAKRWVENRRLLKLTTKKKLEIELLQKRVDRSIISQVLNQDDTDEESVIRQVIIKKRTQTRYQDDKKLIAYLMRQGFNYDLVKKSITKQD